MKPWAFVAVMLGFIAAGTWLAVTGDGVARWVGGGGAAFFAVGLVYGLRDLLGSRPERQPATAEDRAPVDMTPKPWMLLVGVLLLVGFGVAATVFGEGRARWLGVGALAGAAFGTASTAWKQRADRRWGRPRSTVAPDPLPAELRSDEWFGYEWEPGVDQPLTAAEEDLLDALYIAARSWPADHVESYAYRDDDGGLAAGIHVRDQTEILEIRLRLAEEENPGGRVEQTLRRPVNRVEWWHRDRPYAVRYEFADTTEGLVEAFEAQWAPSGLHDELIRTGRARNGGWIQTAALSEPDAVVAVRADGRQFETPPLPDFLWYQCPLERRATD
ncbi:hypothetical protein ACFO1B_12915 [Dactylosporangium siamense]|uniref:hypothetical protein n=1 Tax=Dactylosporangium siamense TaxID=685454 RepID=UPI001943D9FF|nr:hypothetical protein [Dactylosporangium siamense]